MKKINFLTIALTLVFSVLAFSNVNGQDATPTDELKPNQVRPFKLIQELGLTPDQIQQIRRINQTRRPIVQAAQRLWREANETLDAAIYSESSTEEQIKELTKAAQLAQGELLKERTITEFSIRKVLTPEQLVKFRELRERVRNRLNQRKNMSEQNNQNPQPQRPLNRFQRRSQTRQP